MLVQLMKYHFGRQKLENTGRALFMTYSRLVLVIHSRCIVALVVRPPLLTN